MEKIGIFGKKNSVVKYNLDTHESLWVADLPHGQTPKAIAQYEDFLLVIDQNWLGTKNISCFRESSGNLLWRYRYDFLCGWHIYFQPIFIGKDLIFKSGAVDFTKLCCETGRIIYKKSLKQKKLFSFEKFEIIYVGENLIAFSNKEIRKIDIDSGQSEIDHELTKKFNVNGVTAYLGNGVSFVSSISSLNQQLEDEAAAASTSTPAG
jgi:outer membrane protein assembly factor BamB